MLFSATFTILALSLTPALAESKFVRCGNTLTKEKIKAAEASFIARKKASKTSKLQVDFSTVIPVHWHTIQAGKSLEEGNIPVSQINDSIAVLNADYRSTGISFELLSNEYITNSTWFYFAGGDPEAAEFIYQSEMKQALRQGDASTLNIYSSGLVNITTEGLLGYATLPADYQAAPVDDGVVLRYSTVPGGSFDGANLGKTLTHEVGHWLGLYHTFEGGCDGNGDGVLDTPAQLNSTKGCPSSPPDSCPGQPGRDPIHNFMDYSDDICLLEFTPGQIQRMQEQIVAYRGVSV
ncbi:unnamed protein product [Rhizoctonia solani]|uniref:Extracellular metalloprotease n=1 Tax=Rhizoctonia solani AG-3 Rhs1AP TaxID=1086054 RepID=X8JE03_9AGAM|nr:extracellular metalloprotease [Rhizoctonia solani AG-3 Rhs1AP]CAE6521325.1 unnamed protein product [Rhizoctonia solani]